MSSGGGQRRLSDLLSAVPRSSVGSSLDTTLAADEELLVRFWTAAAAPSREWAETRCAASPLDAAG